MSSRAGKFQRNLANGRASNEMRVRRTSRRDWERGEILYRGPNVSGAVLTTGEYAALRGDGSNVSGEQSSNTRSTSESVRIS